MKKGLIFKVRLLFIIIWLLALGFFLSKTIVPNGSVVYKTNFSKDHRFIGALTPVERVEKMDQGRKIIGDPVYFSLYYPRHFEEAELKIKYKWLNDDRQIFSAGMLADNRLWQYYLQPMENTIIEDLLVDWHVTQETDIYFLQKEKQFDSQAEFLNSDFNKSELALYNLTSQEIGLTNYVLPVEQKEKIIPLTLEISLRGHHQFFVYHPGGNFKVDLRVQDLNQNGDYDPADLILYFQDKIILNSFLEDDDNNTDNGQVSSIRDLNLQASNLPEGLYKVEIKVNDDIVIKELKSSSNYLVFADGIRLAPGASNVTVYTNRDYLRATTVNPESIQEIKFGGEVLNLTETYRQYYWVLEDKTPIWNKVALDKTGIMLSNDGLFTFNQSTAFDPEVTQLAIETDIENINYIIAKYQPITRDGDWNIAKASFSLYRAYYKDNKYNFMLSIPGLSHRGEAGLIIDSIEVELKGKGLWEKIKETIKE